LAFSSSVVGGRAVDRLLDAVELADAVQRLLGDRRRGGGVYVAKLSTHVGPAGGLDDLRTGEQLVESGIAVSMNDAAEVLQVRARMLALAVRRVEEQRRRRPGPSERSLIAYVMRWTVPALTERVAP
jgi:hypothetical protein